MPTTPLICPSILASDFAKLGAEVAAIEAAGADWVHVDVMDGHFVPNITIGPDVVKALRPHTSLPFDVHLMVAPVDPWLEAYRDAGADILTVHPESGPHLHRTLGRIRQLGAKAGVVLNPGTPLSALEDVIDLVDLVLLMSVNPGFGGQSFIGSTLKKIERTRAMLDAAGSKAHLQIDGGVTALNAGACVAAGADALVAGTAVFKGGPDAYAANIAALKAASLSPIGPFADRSPAPASGVGPEAIPGLRGAPVRTPVRTSGVATGPALWPAIAGRVLTRQMWIELYGLPGYAQTLAMGKAVAFSATPRDFRPHDAALGKAVLGGRFLLAGSNLEAEVPADPWNRPSPSKAFASDLHAFAWLPPLMAQGDRGAREAVRLTLAWADTFARWSPFAWDPAILSRRVYNLACAARRMGAVCSETDRLRLADVLGRQARQLLRPPGGLAGKAERLTAAAVAGCVLAGPPGAGIRRAALSRLPGALRVTVFGDGGHASRRPEAGMELLLDLLTLDDALSQLSETAPEAVGGAIIRLTTALRLQTLPDGRLAGFQGGGPSTVARVAAARAHDEHAEVPGGATGTVGGLTRIRSPLMTIVADTASPGRGPWSETACAQPLALEIVCGKDRLVTGCGWTPRAADRQGLRLTPGHSTLTLGEQSFAEPLGGWKGELLGARLFGRAYHGKLEQRDGDGAVWLEIEHDAWAAPFGLLHQRRLYLDQRLDELRAEERLHPCPGHKDVVRAIAAPYAVRFHLEPGVQASLARDRRSILLRGHSGRGWWFRTDGPDVAIEPSVHIDEGLTRRSLQVVVRGSARTDAETRIRWKLSPAGASSDPV